MTEALPPLTYRRSLSPSRAGDFQNCPLLYRFRTIDRLPEPADPVMVRGTLVHAVLEDLFAEDAPGRTLQRAVDLLPGEWAQLREAEPRLAELFTAEQAADEAAWLASCVGPLETYFAMEDPRWLEPAAREQRVSYEVDGVAFGGIIDRVDVAPDGRIRVVDYKTGKSPHPRYEDRAMFQMKFYALVIWRTRGVIPTLLQLMYLGDGSFLRYEPSEDDLVATEHKLLALWTAIERAIELRDFPPRRSGLCGWCAHQAICPEFGGTPPELPVLQLEPAPPLA
ncbi:RecB family exonuclease [Aeromicrobium stalagmiti]|uniref:RecB family exonuclease n=1 Tax=Aeromicrobium stalagmiti TaxID=2738988 RepID=UPI0015693F77|nr:PD-(D/E)XK nuclease family protein [Aeromicrobium stalagmiti]NRQ50718.1 PD-(D/E)XK nuclease family protein [Aeromicrobium stalagmiti]